MKSVIYFAIALVLVLTSSVPAFANPLRDVSTFSCADVTEIPQVECEALVALYNGTNGSGWTNHTNWLVTNTPSIWYGVQVIANHVKTLLIFYNQLSGSIPVELADLSNLTYLDLDSNQLSGNIPGELGNLTNLGYLHLNSNQLSGSIPAELGNLTSLKQLYLHQNHLNGSIPAELGTLTNLRELGLYSNQLTGSIPHELGSLISLTGLLLSNNNLSGSIPAELGNLTSLQFLWLHDNKLTGNIPPTFINLVDLKNPGEYYGYDGLDLDSNILNIPVGYPDPLDPMQVFLHQKDPDWQLYQGFQQLIGNSGGELTSQDGRTDLLIPDGALVTDTTFTFIPLPVPRQSSGLLAFAHNSYELSAADAIGNPVTIFNLPLTVTLTYTDADIFRIPEDTLGLYYWDEAGGLWADSVTTCPAGEYVRDPGGNMFALPLCHLTEFGVFGTPNRLFLPVAEQ